MAFHIQLALPKPSFQQEGKGQMHCPPPDGGDGGVHTGLKEKGQHLAKAGMEAHFWKGETGSNAKPTPVSGQITMNSTESE